VRDERTPPLQQMQTYSVRRGPFSVPQNFEVLQSDGFGAFGDSVLVAVKPGGGDAGTSSACINSAQSGSTTSAAGPACQLVVQRHKKVIADPQAMFLVTKVLKLQAALPADMPGVLPIVDAYCTSDCREDIYIAYPKVNCTLADLIHSSTTLSTAQIIFVVRELAIALRNFHASKIAIGGGVRPESIGITTPLVDKNSVTLMNFTFAESEGDPKRAHLLCGKGPEEARREANERLVFQQNLCYFAPEDVLQFQSSATTQSDMWSLGCILYVLLLRKPVFSASDANSYMSHVTSFLGMPHDAATFIKNPHVLHAMQQSASDKKAVPLPIPLWTDESTRQIYLLMKRLLVMDPAKRATAEDVLGLPIFTGGVGGAITKPPLIQVPPSWKLEVPPTGSEPERAAVTAALYELVRVV
jgi:serine/threonine protein kinase